jgi:hypothetical protein
VANINALALHLTYTGSDVSAMLTRISHEGDC